MTLSLFPDSETMSDLPLSATYVSVEVSSDEEGGDMELAEDVWGWENREEAREENREVAMAKPAQNGASDLRHRSVFCQGLMYQAS